MDQLISTLELYFGKKAPQLPANIKEIIVKIAPYLAIIGAIVLLPALLLVLGLGSMFGAMPYGAYGGAYAPAYTGFGIWTLFTLIILVLHVIAIPGLFKRTSAGWNFMFYATLVSGLQNLLTFNLVGLVLGLIISFYFLFQVRPLYFGGMSSVATPPPAI